ncbi:sensor histidine kinase [Aestuariispira ectoiniformans]|uniref:sensor histidine kinase n=1 Tax=Aestuariispira ectoiniformans TaxID=2775080 RepID=UPI00223C43E7|nr:HAMP domain-containing sensor histidine kinase [Aestuariispira ectoiniformans]
MPTAPSNPSRIRRNILIYTSLGAFCVAMITAVVLAYPLYLKQRDHSRSALEHVARLEAVSLAEYSHRLREVALQVAADTRARLVLEDYNRHKITKTAVQAMLRPVLTDALVQGEDVVGIQRVDANHNRLVSVGERIDPLFWPPVPGPEQGMTVAGPVAVNGQWRLIVRSLIRVPGEKEPLGTDILSFSSDGLARVLAQGHAQAQGSLAVLAARVNGDWRFLQGQENGQLVDLAMFRRFNARPALTDRLLVGASPTGYYEDGDVGFAPAVVPGTDWHVMVRRAIESRYGAFYSALRLSVAVAAVLAALGALVALVLTRSLSVVPEKEAVAQDGRIAEKTRSLMDITEELKSAREDAEEASRVKSRFLATTSQELRTPLSAIRGYAELISNPSPSDANLERLAYFGYRIYETSDQIMSMIDNLLDFSKVEAGKVRLAMDDVSLRDVLGMSMRLVEPMARERKIDLSLTIDPTLDIIQADREALSRMVGNLLSNAVKFTDPSGHVALSASRGEGGALEIEVSDTGRGMSAGQLRKALRPFEQADIGVARQYPGTGLGLALVNGLVALHGGRLVLESEPGAGTRARLVFPDQQAVAA